MPHPGQKMTPGRRKLVHIVTKYVRDRYPRVVENDDIAQALGLTREQVRNSIRNYMNAQGSESDIVEDGSYRYVAVSPNESHAAAKPTSGAPTNHIVNVGDGPAPNFRYLLTVGDGEVLLQDDVKDVWSARKL